MLKRNSVWLFGAFMLLSAGCFTVIMPVIAAASSTETNLLTNWSFEDDLVDGQPPGWPVMRTVKFGGEEMHLSTERAFHGTTSLRIDKRFNDKNIGIESEYIPTTPGTRYVASARVFLESGRAAIYMQFFDSEMKRLNHPSVEIGDFGGWYELRVEGTAAADAAYVNVLLYMPVAAVGVVYFDSIKLEQIR